MADKTREELCKDVSTAKIFLTKADFDGQIPNDYKVFPNSKRPAILDYTEMRVNVANEPVSIRLLCCWILQQYVYISYGFIDLTYFVFIELDQNFGIRLLALAEPSPIRDDSFQNQEALETYYWGSVLPGKLSLNSM